MKTLILFLLFVSTSFAQVKWYNDTLTGGFVPLGRVVPPDTTGQTNKKLTVAAGGGYSWTSTTPSFSISSTIVDLTSPASVVVKDSLNSANTKISVTSKPSIPQFYYVVKTADIPTNTNVSSYMAILCIGGKNRDAANGRTINWVGCRGTNPATEFAVGSASVAITANQNWHTSLFYNSRGVVAGDTLSIKFWGSLADTIDYRYLSIYFIPRQITGGSNYYYFYGTNNTANGVWDDATVIKGAVAGVTYTNTSQPNICFMDSATSSVVVTTNVTAQAQYIVGVNQYISYGNSAGAISDVTNNGGTTTASVNLYQLPASATTSVRRIKYLRKFTYTIN